MIKPFEEAHIAMLELDADHHALAVASIPTLRHLSDVKHGGTIVASDGTVVGIYGAGPVDPSKLDEAEVFLFLNPKAAQRYAGTLVKDLRHELHRARERYVAVRAVSKEGSLFFRWFGALGFKFDGAGARGLAWTLTAFLLTLALDYLLAPRGPYALAGAETVALIALSVSAVASTGVAIANYEASQSAAGAQKDLAGQQAQQLRNEQAAASAQAAQQATTGETFGFDKTNPVTGFGFGKGGGNDTNAGRGQITGMS